MPIAINLEFPAAMLALQPVDRLPLHKLKMAIPPFPTTGIGAESLMFPTDHLLDGLATAFAGISLCGRFRLCLRCVYPTAVGLDGIL